MATLNPTPDLINIENLIASHDAKLTTLSTQLKTEKGMLQNILDNDPEYSKLSEEANKLGKQRLVAKQKVLKQPNSISLLDKIKDYQSQIRELKVALSEYLTQYVQVAGTRQLEGPDGAIRQIIYTAKLVKAK